MVFFYLVPTGWIFDISLCDNSINQSINQSVGRNTVQQIQLIQPIYLAAILRQPDLALAGTVLAVLEVFYMGFTSWSEVQPEPMSTLFDPDSILTRSFSAVSRFCASRFCTSPNSSCIASSTDCLGNNCWTNGGRCVKRLLVF